MARIIRPRIVTQGGKAVANAGDDWSARLLSYIPLTISGAYPVLDNALAAYAKNGGYTAGISPRALDYIVFLILILYSCLELNKQYDGHQIHGPARRRIQFIQTLIMIGAFVLWTFSIRGIIWGQAYNAALALILNVLFIMGTRYLPPPGITVKEANDSGFAALVQQGALAPPDNPPALNQPAVDNNPPGHVAH